MVSIFDGGIQVVGNNCNIGWAGDCPGNCSGYTYDLMGRTTVNEPTSCPTEAPQDAICVNEVTYQQAYQEYWGCNP